MYSGSPFNPTGIVSTYLEAIPEQVSIQFVMVVAYSMTDCDEIHGATAGMEAG